jgi:hypothetical protein
MDFSLHDEAEGWFDVHGDVNAGEFIANFTNAGFGFFDALFGRQDGGGSLRGGLA